MLRSVLALAVRSLREDTRSLQAHVYRLLFAAGIFVVLTFIHFQGSSLGAPGLNFFEMMCWINFLLISAGAVSIFATPITEEKEEATLGLLRMAGINPMGLLLGKSTTRLWVAVLVLTVQFPFTLLAITLGGVTWDQIIAAYLSLLAYLVLVAQLGTFCSVVCSRSSSAAMLSGLLLGSFLVLPYYVGKIFEYLFASSRFWPFDALSRFCLGMTQASIWYVRNEIVQTGAQSDVAFFQVWTNLLGALVLFVITALTFDWFTRDHLTSAPGRGGVFRWRSQGSGVRAGNWLSPGRAWVLPVAWKEFYFSCGGFPTWFFKFFGYGVLITTFWFYALTMGATGKPWWAMYGSIAWLTVGVVGGIDLARHLAWMFREELRWQTFGPLLMTPGSLLGITASKLVGSWLAWFPGVFWLMVGVVLDIKDVGWFFREVGEEMPPLLAFFLLHYFVFLFLTMWLSLVMKWGAVPLAFTIAYMIFWPMLFGCLSTMNISQGSANALFAMMDLGCLMLMAVLAGAIALQLRLLAERA